MLQKIGWLILWTMLPVTELRFSIPLGIAKYTDLSPVLVVAICVIANIAIAPVIYLSLDLGLKLVRRINAMNRLYEWYQGRVIERMKPKVEKYGVWGLGIFIGIPLPGSGVYSGAVGAHALGMSLKKHFLASIIGVLMAATLVTIFTYAFLAGASWLGFFLKAPA